MPKKISGAAAIEHSIIIDPVKGWKFSSENDVHAFFSETIAKIQDEFSILHQDEDFDLSKFKNSEEHLEETLLSPDEIWDDEESCKGIKISIFIKTFEGDHTPYHYIALTYLYEGRPTFVFTHFPTRLEEMASTYRRTLQIFSREAQGSVQFVDALSSSDDLAIGLYNAMLKLRSDTDIPEFEFPSFENLRTDVLNEPDEIWKSDELHGRSVVKFIRELTVEEKTLFYVIVTAEEPNTHSHYILFSFPTLDSSLVDRYRQGEKLDPAEFVREESH